ncbi:cyclin-H-like [Oculina patagonica]
MFHTSTQRRHWTFKSEHELMNTRQEVNNAYCERFCENFPAKKDVNFLSVEEGMKLIEYYQIVLIEVCDKFQPPVPNAVTATAVTYLKRFYLKTSVMDHPPKEMFLVCLYMACKVEEHNLSVDRFVEILPAGRREKTKDFILAHELLLMQRLDFHLTVHNPYRPMEGFIIDFKTRCPKLGDPEKWRPSAEEFLRKALMTDVCLLFPPSQIALAALFTASRGSIASYIGANLGEQQQQHVLSQIENIATLVTNQAKSTVSKEQIKSLEQKLKACRNPENNPDNKLFKKKKADRETAMDESL